MPARASLEPVECITGALNKFLRRGRLKTVHFAEGRNAPPQMAFAVHFPRLSLTLAGSDEIEVECAGSRRTLKLGRGEALFVPANCWNKPAWTRRATVLHLLFGQKQIGVSLVRHDGRSTAPVRVYKSGLPRTGSEPLAEILAAVNVLAARESRSPLDTTLITALLQVTLSLFGRVPAARGRKARDTYERACLYVQEHFHQEVTRESVARQFRLNPNHLSRLFRREGLMRFTDYLARVRIERAKYLLKHYDMGLNELAAACGFQENAYFCRVFKRRTGQTPTGYRLEARAGIFRLRPA